ncbi:retrovirus-related pol polyprotein from transposon TNT 1-94 [Tanacetum coccineum]
MIENQRLQKDRKGVGFTEDRALTSEVHLKVKLELDEWIKDSGCSWHMTGNKDLFSTYEAINGVNRSIRTEHPRPETIRIKESLNVRLEESSPPKSSPLVDGDIIESQIIENQIEGKENGPLNKEIVNIKESKDHPIGMVIEPKNVKEDIQDESWTMAMQEELNQFVTNDVWSLVPPPENQTVIGTKWVIKNKLDENGVISRNKARLVTQGYNQQEGIYFDETNAPVARLESIRILLAYACANDLKLFQMNVKNALLNGFINEEVYVSQPPRYPKGTGVETIVYADSDHAGDYVDHKTTSGVCTFMRCCLTSWFSKKDTALAISTTEAEYVSTGKAYQ